MVYNSRLLAKLISSKVMLRLYSFIYFIFNAITPENHDHYQCFTGLYLVREGVTTVSLLILDGP